MPRTDRVADAGWLLRGINHLGGLCQAHKSLLYGTPPAFQFKIHIQNGGLRDSTCEAVRLVCFLSQSVTRVALQLKARQL